MGVTEGGSKNYANTIKKLRLIFYVEVSVKSTWRGGSFFDAVTPKKCKRKKIKYSVEIGILERKH